MIFTVTIEIPDAQVEQMRERAKKHEVANVEQKTNRLKQTLNLLKSQFQDKTKTKAFCSSCIFHPAVQKKVQG